jgi:acyl carrier protein
MITNIISNVVKDWDLLIDNDESLLGIGVDSLNMIELVVGIENEFDFELLDEDLIIENFETINSIIKMLEAYEVKEVVDLSRYRVEISQ